MFSVVTPVDFTNPEDLRDVAQMTSLIQRGIPIRFGLVPLTPTAEASDQARLVYHLRTDFGVEALTMYLKEFHETGSTAATESLYNGVVNSLEDKPNEVFKWDEIIASEPFSHNLELASRWVRRLRADSEIRSLFVNGLAHPREGNWMQPMSVAISNDLQTIQKNVFRGVIEDDTSIPGFFLEKAARSRNTYITPEDESSVRVLDVNQLYNQHAALFEQVPVLEAAADSSKDNWATLTVISDLNTDAGIQLLLSALAFKRGNSGVRLDIVHNSAAPTGAGTLIAGLKANTDKLSSANTAEEVKSLFDESTTSEESYKGSLVNFLSRHNIAQGASVLLLNGRVVGPIASDTPFDEDDFRQLLAFEQRARITPVYGALEELGLADKLSSPMAAAKVTSIVALSTMSDLPEGIFESAAAFRTSMYEKWESAYTAIEVGNPETASVHIAGLLDPASEKAQKWAPVLKVLSELDGVYLKLFMNPKEKLSELPVKRFYRYVMDSKPSFDENGKVKALNATFKGLPSEALLTAGMDVPPAWLVAAKDSVHDLDNIKLSSIGRDVEAMYELEHILIEGHSREGQQGAPPKGAQLVLGTEKDPLVTDTIIMANLGFFQFKANPGVYDIHLKEGRTTDIFDIESVGALGYAAVPGDEGTDVTLMDFQGTTLYPRLSRKAGMEDVDVLAENDGAADNIMSKGLKFAENLLGKTKSVSNEQHAEINVFSVASGHLYERMLNIMMVSVMKHTKHTVKFWFIEQFLSPSFKDTIPYLAEEYGFKYEMVTYKWPHWLRQQKEKQREIWGYKILFLDVLFPLSLDKVIFVDADQIVRTDMIDLVNHDLEGAPYGFTPMCDSRTEMEGFRFWKQGYWASFLRGKPYHISALYVVDLRRFRALAAGDRLRQQYHSLSADPNSLANLDQDLPNNMQFQIPIHSLPQEWLWCETWCSDESFGVARTIDLCNNPQTKEPKLDRARRQVPEWTMYDDEIDAVVRRRKGVKGPEEKMTGDETVEIEKNTKSRKLEETGHSKDEL
jgi:UDP-glucose:glycoprotein glucosyltransferase